MSVFSFDDAKVGLSFKNANIIMLEVVIIPLRGTAS